MKKLLRILAILPLCVAAQAQTPRDTDLGQRIRQLEDRAALKALVDTFSNLADQKDVQKQVLLFTEDATVESWSEGKPGTTYKGRKQLAEAFGKFLARFETVYHINGQQTVELHGDRATGVAYCQVTLIGTENGKRIKSTNGVYYNDEYVRRGDTWLIAKRRSYFTWRDREEMVPAN